MSLLYRWLLAQVCAPPSFYKSYRVLNILILERLIVGCYRQVLGLFSPKLLKLGPLLGIYFM